MNTIPCEGCGVVDYPDFIIPFEFWIQISPSGDDNGMLCPNCICQRLRAKGFREGSVSGAMMSGPIRAVDETVMHLMRDLENLTLAIGGRKNAYGVQLEARVRETGPVAGSPE